MTAAHTGGRPLAGLTVDLGAMTAGWDGGVGTTDAGGVATLFLSALEKLLSETTVYAGTGSATADLALALTNALTRASGESTSPIVVDALDDYTWIGNGDLLIMSETTFSVDFYRDDYFLWNPDSDTWPHLLSRNGTGEYCD